MGGHTALRVRVFQEDGGDMKAIVDLRRDETGATVIEYALIASLISIVIVIGAYAIGNELGNIFLAVANALEQ